MRVLTQGEGEGWWGAALLNGKFCVHAPLHLGVEVDMKLDHPLGH